MSHTLIVPADAFGTRLDRFVASSLPLSRARLQSLIEQGAVQVNGLVITKAAHKLRGGERVLVTEPEPTPLGLSPQNIPLDIIYEDDDLVVINKPAGMAVHPGAGVRDGTLVNALLAHCKDLSGIGGTLRPGIVHRLDKGTSGVIIAAKNDFTHAGLAKQFAERTTKKRYTAFVLGVLKESQGTIKTFYGRHPTERKRFTGRVTSGRVALTSYRVRYTAHGLSRLDVLLGTGRTHQIRVHMFELGHAIVGDPLYGGTRLARISDESLRSLAHALTHQALHAAKLELVHPRSGVALVLRAPLPSDLRAIAVRLRPL